MAAKRRKRSDAGKSRSWAPPQGCPPQIDGESAFAYKLFAVYWAEWQTLPAGDDRARRQSAFTTSERLYIQLRPTAKTTNHVLRFMNDWGWECRCNGEDFHPQPWKVKPKTTKAATPTPMPEPPVAAPPAQLPDYLRSLLTVGSRSLSLEISQLQRVQGQIDRALLDGSIAGFDVDATGLDSVDSLLSLINAAKQAIG